MKKTAALAAVLIIAGASLTVVSASPEEQEIPVETCAQCHSERVEKFLNSLHYTVHGQESEWAKGIGEELGVPLPGDHDEGTGCYKCHTDSCTSCHHVKEGSHMGQNFNIITPDEMDEAFMEETCVHCHHARTGVNYVGLNSKGEPTPWGPDVHYTKGLLCWDCHTDEEIHGDGTLYSTEKLAVKIRCEDCHKNPSAQVRGMTPTQWDPDIAAHRIHDGKVDCAACHAAGTQNCWNCHIDILLAEGEKVVDKVTFDDFYLIKGFEGEVKAAYSMWTVYEDMQHKGWGEYTPHTITDEPHDCSFCHGVDAASRYPVEGAGEALGPEGAALFTSDEVEHLTVVASEFSDGCSVCHSDLGAAFSEAQGKVEAALKAVEVASSAGADVADLSSKANQAKQALEEAKAKLHKDPSGAMSALQQAISLADEVLGAASSSAQQAMSELHAEVEAAKGTFNVGLIAGLVVGLIIGAVIVFLIRRE
ncbi:MAG: hypothetical protein DRO06_02770 [Thermoproteota archaeon]|nr:MAG: hypothetical protein DRO06_02770 [Candidatus Korarchaeota archaeon]